MTRDEIIRMARAAQLAYGTDDSLLCSVEKFFKAAYEAGAAAERESCAKMCDETRWSGYVPPEDGAAATYYDDAATNCAAAIRARGQK